MSQEIFRLGSSLPDEVEKVKSSGGFCEILTIYQLAEHLRNEFKSINLQEQKFKSSFLKYILEKVKTIIKNTKSFEKEQLKQLTIQIIKHLIPNISDSDLKTIEDTIDTLINNKLVKAVDKSFRGKIKKFLKKI
jgi:hypothetical protein